MKKQLKLKSLAKLNKSLSNSDFDYISNINMSGADEVPGIFNVIIENKIIII
jgi:hypothetical protein